MSLVFLYFDPQRAIAVSDGRATLHNPDGTTAVLSESRSKIARLSSNLLLVHAGTESACLELERLARNYLEAEPKASFDELIENQDQGSSPRF